MNVSLPRWTGARLFDRICRTVELVDADGRQVSIRHPWAWVRMFGADFTVEDDAVVAGICLRDKSGNAIITIKVPPEVNDGA